MKLSLVYEVVRWEEKAIHAAAKKKGIDIQMINIDTLSIDLEQGKLAQFGDIALQRCLSYFKSIHLTAVLESKGIQVVNPFRIASITGNKLYGTLALLKAGVPTPKTMISFTPETALSAIEDLGYPVVLKPTMGSWGRLVASLSDRDAASSVLEDREQMFPIYRVYYLQERVNRPPRDIRGIVIGDQLVAAIYRLSAPNDWKTNTARGGKPQLCPITKELEDICAKAAKAVGGDGLFGVDLMETPNGLVVHEVNNTTEFKNTVPTTGVDIPSLIIEYLQTQKK